MTQTSSSAWPSLLQTTRSTCWPADRPVSPSRRLADPACGSSSAKGSGSLTTAAGTCGGRSWRWSGSLNLEPSSWRTFLTWLWTARCSSSAAWSSSLSAWATRVQERVVDAWRYGVPQFRQRLILVAVRDGGTFEWPAEDTPKSDGVPTPSRTCRRSRADGARREAPRAGSTTTARRTAFQRAMRAGVSTDDGTRCSITSRVRYVRTTERASSCWTQRAGIRIFPTHLKRYRDDIFDDKYKRLSGDDVSRTITAHIAKDGYWYIHPEQNRTLTVREAARTPDVSRLVPVRRSAIGGLQADRQRRSSAARATRSGQRSSKALDAASGRRRPRASRSASALASWFRGGTRTSSPWLHSASTWHVLLGETAAGSRVDPHRQLALATA